ncbi:MAG TPA: ABC transporter substrate-binding protein [Acidimicrobiales bacterium]|nr:ABC transporter substrate-binding protein [Acidimicrobiales bacterium]
MKILSLLPSATEIVFALGLEDSLVGVTAECDFPAAARDKSAVSFPAVGAGPEGPTPTAAEIDGAVAGMVASGSPLYRLDEERIRTLSPDLILAQDLCRVCAVPSGDVTAALDRLGCRARVLSLDPTTLDDVLAAVRAVAEVAGVVEQGRTYVESLRARLERIRRLTADAGRRRVLEMEWSDPVYVGGHWVPEMVEAAGGRILFSRTGVPSTRLSWAEIGSAQADVVVFAPCGYGLAEAVAEGEDLLRRPESAGVPEVWALDGSAYFSRPGPRLVDGVELLASVLHPGRVPVPAAGGARRLR